MNETSPLVIRIHNDQRWNRLYCVSSEGTKMTFQDHGDSNETIELHRLETTNPDENSFSFSNNNNNNNNEKKLGVLSMAIMVFYSVSGGPFGVETTVRSGGYFYSLLGFLVFPFVWSIQEAFMTAELGTAFPEASGGVVWVEEAFGPLAGWLAGYLSWVAGATDNAIYPVLFLDYLLQMVGTEDSQEVFGPVLRFCLVTTTTIALAYVNWRGLDVVGKLSVFICIMAMSPFLIMIVVGATKVDTSRWWTMPETMDVDKSEIAGGFFPSFCAGGVLWRPFLNNLFWNLNSFDSAGSLVGELQAGASFFRAMLLGLAIVVSCYFFPLLIAIGSSDADQADWNDGFLASINAEVVGPWLGAWTVFAAGISNIGLFQAELSSDAFQLMGMADRGYLPKIFGERSQHGTPTYGLILGTIVICLMAVSDLDSLIEMLNFNYGFALLFEYAAFFKLRVSRPDLERPYKIPLGTFGCVIFFLPTVLATLLVMSLATYWTYAFSLATWISGYALYKMRDIESTTKEALHKPSNSGIYEQVEHTETETESDDSYMGEEPYIEDSERSATEVML